MTTPQMGDFGITAGGGWAMWIVRLGTFSRYGHACVVVRAATDAAVIVEAMPGGARQRVARPEEFLWSRLLLTGDQRSEIAGAALACVGLPYDWLAIAGFLVRFWGAKLRGRSADHPDDQLICSELVVWVYRQAGIDLAPAKAAGDISPGDLADYLLRNPPAGDPA